MKKRMKKTDDQLKAELLALAESGAPRPKANTELGRALQRFTTPLKTDDQLKKELLALAKSGAPRPGPKTELGRALKRFTTPPTLDMER